MNVETIAPRKLHDLLASRSDADVIDVRTPVEFREVHLPAARNVPLDQLNAETMARLRRDDASPLYVICRSGNRAQQACERMQAAGIEPVVNVEGGVQAWEADGLPVLRGKKAVSLERQVRMAAGSLVLLGVALGVLVHPWALLLAGFVGGGLVFSGITDTCGMGLLLARMPWNRVALEPPDAVAATCSLKTCH